MKKIIISVCIIISILAAAAGCKINGVDLKELIETDVKTHNNPTHYLTIETTTGGTVSPGSRVEIVDEVPIVLTATAETGYAFKQWLFTAGEASATLGAAENSSNNSITISGSDVTIQAVFVRQPVVVSYFPQNDDVARNMPVRIVFSKIVDGNSITGDTIQVFDNQLGRQINGELEVNGSEISFYAQDSSLDQTAEGLFLWESNRHYQVYIRQNVLDTDGIALLEEISWFFSTGTEIDNTPPVITSFSIESPDGNTSYTNDQNVLLSFDAEDESMIPIRAVKYWNQGDLEPEKVTLVADEIDQNGKIPFLLASEDGIKQVNLKVYDMANNSDETSAVITLDETAPILTFFELIDPDETPHDADGFANTRNLTFQLSGTDSNAIESLGWVINGSPAAMTWQDYTAGEVPVILPDSDGEYTLSVSVRDIAGNLSSVEQETITLDRSAPTGTVQIKGGASWAGAADQNAALSITRSDLSVAPLGEITMAVQVDGDGWSSGSLSSYRAYSAEITDVDLFPDGHTPSAEEEVTVSVKLVDVFGYERIVTDTIRLDFTAPEITLNIWSYDSGTYSYCKVAGQPSVRLTISKTDSGGSGLADYRWDTDKDGVEWSGWITDANTSVNVNTTFDYRCGNRYAYIQVRDQAGNMTATDDYILNHYHVKFRHYALYVSDDGDGATAGAGEIYWDCTLYERATSGSSWDNKGYAARRPDGSSYTVSMDNGDSVLISTLNNNGCITQIEYFKEAPPYQYMMTGRIKEDDTGTLGGDDEISELGTITIYPNFRKYQNLSVTGSPAGYFTFYNEDNLW